MLPRSEGIIKTLNRIVEVFSNPIEIEAIKVRWKQIKGSQTGTIESVHYASG